MPATARNVANTNCPFPPCQTFSPLSAEKPSFSPDRPSPGKSLSDKKRSGGGNSSSLPADSRFLPPSHVKDRRRPESRSFGSACFFPRIRFAALRCRLAASPRPAARSPDESACFPSRKFPPPFSAPLLLPLLSDIPILLPCVEGRTRFDPFPRRNRPVAVQIGRQIAMAADTRLWKTFFQPLQQDP